MATKNYVALDVGTVRIGIAFAGKGLMIARPVRTIAYADDDWSSMDEVIKELEPTDLVVGLPRSLSGQETSQTQSVRDFATLCAQRYNLPIHLQDEALTSVRAKEILSQSNQPIDKKEVDAVAASLILSDYLEEQKQ